MNDEGEAVIFVTKERAKNILSKLIQDNTQLGIRYTSRLIEEQKKELKGKGNKNYQNWLVEEIKEIKEDIKANKKMIWRADIEDGYNLFWMNAENNLLMRRCSSEEYEAIYKPRNRMDYVV